MLAMGETARTARRDSHPTWVTTSECQELPHPLPRPQPSPCVSKSWSALCLVTQGRVGVQGACLPEQAVGCQGRSPCPSLPVGSPRVGCLGKVPPELTKMGKGADQGASPTGLHVHAQVCPCKPHLHPGVGQADEQRWWAVGQALMGDGKWSSGEGRGRVGEGGVAGTAGTSPPYKATYRPWDAGLASSPTRYPSCWHRPSFW